MLGIFSMPSPLVFPKGFLWGSATAGHQIEGDNINSQNWLIETTDECFRRPGFSPSGKACNFWNLWKNDFAMLSELEHQCFRMSVEWSRIEPREGERDMRALAVYLDMLEELKKRNIKVCVSLHHFTHPQWFEAKGEFFKRENIDDFVRHLEFLVPKIAPYVDFWNIFNEFNNCVDEKLFDRKTNCLIAHARGAAVIRSFSHAPIGTAHAMCPYFPSDPNDEFDVMRSKLTDWVINRFFYHAMRTGEIIFPYRDVVSVPGLKDSNDFWSINYYTRHFVTARRENGEARRPECNKIKAIARDFYLEEFYPQGLKDGLNELKDKPIYITENGFSCDDDRLRILYLARQLQSLHEAIRQGCDVRGYFYWSLMDNYEWGSYLPKFGMVSVNRETFERTPKPTAYFFREIIRGNGFDRDLLLKYLPEFKDWTIYQ